MLSTVAVTVPRCHQGFFGSAELAVTDAVLRGRTLGELLASSV